MTSRVEPSRPPSAANRHPEPRRALLTGLLAAVTIFTDSPAHVEVLTFGYALAYGNGISARNAGRPFIAIGQLVLAVLPVLVACFVIATPALLTLSALAR